MTTGFTLKKAPVFEPVSLADLKTHARVDNDDEDLMLSAYMSAARGWIEDYTGRALTTQTWQASLDRLMSRIWLPRAAPLQSVTFVKYYDADNALQTWASANYITPAFSEPACIEVLPSATWPSTYSRSDAVQVEYVVGYTDGACPAALQVAVMQLATHFFENRETVLVGQISKEVEHSVTSLCTPYRLFWQEPSW